MNEENFSRSVEKKVAESEAQRRKHARKLRAFSMGFAEGFGSTGCLFMAGSHVPGPYWLRQVAEASTSRRMALINNAKMQIVSRYVDAATASKLCSVSTESNRNLSLWAKDRVIGKDFRNELIKTHG
jgi:hypothetical protein